MAKVSIMSLLQFMKDNNASDLHIAVGYYPTFRIDGSLHQYDKVPKLKESDLTEMISAITPDIISDTLKTRREFDFSFSNPSVGRFRVNVFFQQGTLGAVIRRIPFVIPDLKTLGLPMSTVLDVINRQRGLILVTGPTGQGKSTSIAAMIDYLNKNKAFNIVTIEDPIEYVFTPAKSFIVQRQVGTDTLSFHDALRSVLREDPDIIFVGEMRDLETMSATITAAETGHLVFATLHTNSAAESINRIIDVFPPHQQNQIKAQLSTVLLSVFSQQLIVRKNGKGRVLTVEVLIANPAIRSMIREGRVHEIKTVMQTGKSSGMQTMEASLVELYKKGEITLQDAKDYAFDKNLIEQLLSR